MSGDLFHAPFSPHFPVCLYCPIQKQDQKKKIAKKHKQKLVNMCAEWSGNYDYSFAIQIYVC